MKGSLINLPKKLTAYVDRAVLTRKMGGGAALTLNPKLGRFENHKSINANNPSISSKKEKRRVVHGPGHYYYEFKVLMDFKGKCYFHRFQPNIKRVKATHQVVNTIDGF